MIKKILNIAIIVFACSITLAQAQNKSKRTDNALENSIKQKKYVFTAHSAQPFNAQEIGKVMGKLSGGSQSGIIQLTETYYQLQVTPDSVVVYLPYYGRSYQAKPGTTDGGIKFTSKKFDYTAKLNKRGVWTVQIQPKDTSKASRLTLNIGKEGFSTLYLISNDKQAISYDGTVN